MSIKLMTKVWEMPFRPTEKLVMLALADWANDDGHCWPSIKRLCEKSGLSERAIRNCIKNLVAGGHMTRNEVIGKGVNYVLHPGTTCPRHEMPPARDAATPARRAPNTSIYVNISSGDKSPSDIPAREKPKPGPIVPEWVPAEQWKAWAEMRKAMRKPLSPRAAELAVAKLKRLMDDGHDPGDVLDQSVLNGWQSLYPLKADDRGNHGYATRESKQPATNKLAELALRRLDGTGFD